MSPAKTTTPTVPISTSLLGVRYFATLNNEETGSQELKEFVEHLPSQIDTKVDGQQEEATQLDSKDLFSIRVVATASLGFYPLLWFTLNQVTQITNHV